MPLHSRLLSTTLLLSLTACEDTSPTSSDLGYTVHLLIEVDGSYEEDACVNGLGGIVSGSLAIRPNTEPTRTFRILWEGEAGVLEIVGKRDEQTESVFFRDTLKSDFADRLQVRTLEHEVDGHRVVIYAENMGPGSDCRSSQHSKADYDGSGGDGGQRPAVASQVPSLLDLGGTAANDVWGVGFNGVVMHYDGARWTQWVEHDPQGSIMSLWVSGPSTPLWIVTRSVEAGVESRKLLRGKPDDWLEVNPGTLEGELLDRAWGTSPDDVWVTGYIDDQEGGGRVGVVHHLKDGVWTLPASYVGGRLSGIWGSGPDDIFIGGNDGTGYGGYVGHFVGGQFDWNEYPEQWVGRVWGSGPNDVWTAGGTLTHYDGSVWVESAPLPGRYHQFFGLWGSARDDVWAVGSQGVGDQDYSGIILHYDGSAWSEASMRPPSEVDAVWGSAADDVWVAARFALYHYDGRAWRQTAPSEIALAP